ncbi:MAG: DUF1801 domain-containing protein, partial [Anaerolineales bacterium]|nr:DUF1801 domain-containing protein [Anaerolineales bacterium]
MQSNAKDINAYLKQVPDERRATLDRLRKLCKASLKGYEESMAYGMPCYSRKGIVEVAFASQRQYISLYILRKEVLDAHRERLKGISLGKGCIRYTRPDKIDFDVVKDMLAATTANNGPIC